MQFKLGELIRKERLKRGWSQKGLAERCKISNILLCKIENGTASRDVSKDIARIVELLKIEDAL